MSANVKPLTELPITESDEFIRDALRAAHIPTLMMAIIHLTGDASLLDGDIRPAPASWPNPTTPISEEDQARVRALALEALVAHRDGRPLPPPPSEDTIRRMASFITGTQIDEEYLPMLLEEMMLDGVDKRMISWSAGTAPDQVEKFQTVIIGAGMSGLLAAIRLKEAGIPFIIIEKNDQVGGTWYENKYPGARVDSANHFYSYSFEPNHDWSEHFSRRDELFEYFDRVAEKYQLKEHIHFSTEVTSARYETETGVWRITLRQANNDLQMIEAKAVISAVGQLNRPKTPAFKGLENFKGAAFHSAAWNDGVDLEGKKVAVIGVGASAFQLIPEVAKIATKLTVFQRSPEWMIWNPTYHDEVKEGKKWLMKHVPYYSRWYRYLLFWMAGDSLLPSIEIDRNWPHPDRAVSAANDAVREHLTESMRAQVADRPDLIEKVIPTYPPYGKRMLQDNGHYLKALKQPNVELVTGGVAEVVADGIIDVDGRHHPCDAIVFATGFEATKFLWPIEITGRNNRVLSDFWGDTPRAHLGMTVPGFPNLFILYGPSTNLAHAGSIIFHAECQVRYVMGCLRMLLESGNTSMEVTESAYRDYVERLEKRLASLIWSHPNVHSWYRNERGIVVNTSPWRLLDYWNWTREPEPGEYELN